MEIVVRGQASDEELAAVLVSLHNENDASQSGLPIRQWQRIRRAALAASAFRTGGLELQDGASQRLRRRP
jgi:hypothetical protein